MPRSPAADFDGIFWYRRTVTVPAEWAGKLVYLNAALSVLWFAFRGLFLPALPEWMSAQAWVLYAAGNVIFILYDIALSRLIGGLSARLRPRGM